MCVDSGVRRVQGDQLPRLIAKIQESFPKFAEDEKYIQNIVEIVNSCIYDERLVSMYNRTKYLWFPPFKSMKAAY